MTYSKQMLKALEDTVYTYEQTIIDLEEGYKNVEEVCDDWKGYGYVGFCRFCQVVEVVDDNMDCSQCVLDTDTPGIELPCAHEDNYSGRILLSSILIKHKAQLIKALKNRRDFIIKRAEENGVVLEEVK